MLDLAAQLYAKIDARENLFAMTQFDLLVVATGRQPTASRQADGVTTCRREFVEGVVAVLIGQGLIHQCSTGIEQFNLDRLHSILSGLPVFKCYKLDIDAPETFAFKRLRNVGVRPGANTWMGAIWSWRAESR